MEYQKLSDKLKELVCNKAEDGVCCKEQLEVVNGNIVEKVEEMPYIVRLYLKTGYASSSICGASLIGRQFILSAKHCFTSFWKWCINPTDCTAHFRDLKPGRTNHERGEFYIPITDVFEKEGVSDLAVAKLKYKVEEHPDYKLGVPLQPIRLATENPKPGDEVITGGWGLTGRVILSISIKGFQFLPTLFYPLCVILHCVLFYIVCNSTLYVILHCICKHDYQS